MYYRTFILLLAITTTTLAYPGHAQKFLDQNKVSEFSLDRILCPVIASMVKAGDLVPDSTGRIQVWQLKHALIDGLGNRELFAEFQAMGVVAYERADVNETERERCAVLTSCWWDSVWAERNNVTYQTDRWLNVYTMNGKENVEHGFSSGVRGGATSVPENLCNGVFPCQKRFDLFIRPFANAQGRYYLDDIHKLACNMMQFGDRGGEFSYSATRVLREWQAQGALEIMLNVFGWTDEKGELFMNIEDVEGLYMRAEYPKGWVKRINSCLFSGCPRPALTIITTPIPNCEDKGWWQDTSCPTVVGSTCVPVIGYCKNDNATCIGDGGGVLGRCTCGYGECATKENLCTPTPFRCTYFGERCRLVRGGEVIYAP